MSGAIFGNPSWHVPHYGAFGVWWVCAWEAQPILGPVVPFSASFSSRLLPPSSAIAPSESIPVLSPDCDMFVCLGHGVWRAFPDTRQVMGHPPGGFQKALGLLKPFPDTVTRRPFRFRRRPSSSISFRFAALPAPAPYGEMSVFMRDDVGDASSQTQEGIFLLLGMGKPIR